MEDPLKFDLEARLVTIYHAKLNCGNGLFLFVVVVVVVVVMIMIIMIHSGLTHPEVSLIVSRDFFCL